MIDLKLIKIDLIENNIEKSLTSLRFIITVIEQDYKQEIRVDNNQIFLKLPNGKKFRKSKINCFNDNNMTYIRNKVMHAL